MKSKIVLCAIVLMAYGCGSDGTNGQDGDDGNAGAAGAAALVSTAAEAAGDNCANGGVRIDAGADDNADGALTEDEIDSTAYICDGELGTAGAEGTAGTNGDNGADGSDGSDGLTSLLATADEAAGANCADGGSKIEAGIDDDGNGTLDAAEVDQTSYVCNGAAGAAGLNALVNSTDEPAGANCANAGFLFESGTDTDGNGALDTAEVTSSRYVCNGADGAPGVDGAPGSNGAPGSDGTSSLLDVTAEPAGANCLQPGVRVDWGIDDDGDGVLQPGEIDGTEYVCTPTRLTCADTITTSTMWATWATTGFDLTQRGKGELDFFGVDNATINCTETATTMTITGGLRAVLDPGNTRNALPVGITYGCASAASPQAVFNFVDSTNNGVTGQPADAVCQLMGYSSGVLSSPGGNGCPDVHHDSSTNTWSTDFSSAGNPYRTLVCTR